MSQAKRTNRASDVPVRGDLLAAAQSLDIDVSAAAEAGLERAIAAERTARWQRDNREAIESANRYVETHGVPLAKYRPF